MIPLSKYVKAVFHTRVSVGMRFRMLFETEESSVRRSFFIARPSYMTEKLFVCLTLFVDDPQIWIPLFLQNIGVSVIFLLAAYRLTGSITLYFVN